MIVNNSTYRASEFVVWGGELNFLDGSASWFDQSQSGLTTSSKFAMLPIGLCVMGVLSFVSLFLFRFGGLFFDCTCRGRIAPSSDVDLLTQRVEGQQRFYNRLFNITSLCIILLAQLLVYNRETLLLAKTVIVTFVDAIVIKFDKLLACATSLQENTTNIYSLISQSSGSCSVSAYSSVSSGISASSAEFFQEAEPLQVLFYRVNNAFSYLSKDTSFLDSGLFGIYALIVISVIFFMACHFNRLKCNKQMLFLLGSIVYLITMFAGISFCLATMITADFCLSPVEKFASSSPPGVQDTFRYFSTCSGINQLFVPAESVRLSLSTLQSNIATVKSTGSCASDSTILSIETLIASSYQNINDAESATVCNDVKAQIWAFIPGVCTHLYQFSGSFWISLQGISFLFFMLIILGGIVSQYYDEEDVRKLIVGNFKVSPATNSEIEMKTPNKLSKLSSPQIPTVTPKRISAKFDDEYDDVDSLYNVGV